MLIFGRGPVRSSPAPHQAHFQIHLKYEESIATVQKRCSIPLPRSRTPKQKKPIDQLARNQFGRSSENSLCSAGCTPEKRKLQLPKKKKKKTDQSERLPQHTEKRGPDCLLKWSQSISSLSPDHGVANEPCDRMSTTPRDKRARTNHRNDRWNRQTGSNESMDRGEGK